MVRNNPDAKLPWVTGSSLLVEEAEKEFQQSHKEVAVTGLPRGEPKSVCNSTPRKHILEEFRCDSYHGITADG